jgi:hypothetical protein
MTPWLEDFNGGWMIGRWLLALAAKGGLSLLSTGLLEDKVESRAARILAYRVGGACWLQAEEPKSMVKS